MKETALPIDRSVLTGFGTPVWQFGCARFIMTEDTLPPCAGIQREAGAECARLGKKPFVLGGPTALSIVKKALEESLLSADLVPEWMVYDGFCCAETAENWAERYDFDCVIGVGGGRIMDMAKLCAYFKAVPVLNIPTSSATCAAVSSLSVLYSRNGKTVGTLCYEKSVDAVLADTALLLSQPKRLAYAGVLDAMAKKVEIAHYSINDPGLSAAAVLAAYSYQGLYTCGERVCRDSIYLSVPLTGVISGLSRGRNQSNLAHGLYEAVRRVLTAEGLSVLHGELVAIGLFLQMTYDRREEEIPELRAFMQARGMALTLTEAGIGNTEKNRETLLEEMLHSPYFVDTEENRMRLVSAMEVVW